MRGWMIGEGAGAVVLKKNSEPNQKVYTLIDNIGKANVQSEFDYLELAATGISTQDQNEQNKLLKIIPKDQ